jgi:polyisoprenyl-phosphate glycosyltransferase
MPELTNAAGPVDVSILLPAFNEETAISAVIEEIRAVMSAWHGSWEILVVDDASTDQTRERAEQAGARVIHRVENGGAGAARKTGILEARGTIIAMLDADGSYDPAELPRLLAHFPDYDQVNGARTSEQGDLKPLRVPAKWLVRKLTEVVSGKKIPDLNTGFKLFKRDVMLRYLWVVPPGFSCVTSITLAFLCNDRPVKYVPVAYRKRIGHSKFHPIFDSINYIATAIRIIMYFRPLRVFLPASLVLFAIAATKGAYDLAYSPLGLHDSDIIISLTALIVLSVGMLADLVVAQRRDS